MPWGFPNRGEEEDGAQEGGGCHHEPGLKEGGSWCLQMYLQLLWEPSPVSHHGAVCAFKEKAGSVWALKGPIQGSQWHFGIRATQLGHTVGLSHGTLPAECNSPPPYILWSCRALENSKVLLCLRWSSSGPPRGRTKRIQSGPVRWTAMAKAAQQWKDSSQRRQLGQGPQATAWACLQPPKPSPSLKRNADN